MDSSDTFVNLDPNAVITVTVPYSTLHPPSVTPYDPLSPYDLSDRLVALNTSTDSEIEDEKTVLADSPEKLVTPVYWNGFGSSGGELHAIEQSDSTGDFDAEIEDAMRGVYSSWLAGKSRNGSDGTPEQFLEAIRDVITNMDSNP